MSTDGEEPFDPYRFGKPDVPPPPEYAPPGYVPPPPEDPYATRAGPPPYPPAYGPPPYQPYGYQPAPSGTPGKAVAALVLGIASLVLFWTSFFDIVVIVVATVFGFLGLGDARRRGQGKRLAVAGLICAAVAALLVIGLIVLVVHLAAKCGGLGNSGDPGFNRCLKRHL